VSFTGEWCRVVACRTRCSRWPRTSSPAVTSASPALTLDVSRSSVLPTSICRVPPSFSEISHGRVPGKRSIDGLRTCDATLEQAPKVVGGAGGNKDSAIEMSATDGSQQTSEEGDHEIYELVSLQRVECAQWNNQRSSTRVYACSNMTCTLWHHSDCITVVGERVRRLIGEATGEAIARARWMEANKHVKRRAKKSAISDSGQRMQHDVTSQW
jgi:hypothetical protein